MFPLPRRRGGSGWGSSRVTEDPVVDRIVAHLASIATDGVPDSARSAAKTFIADSLAVGIAGARAPWRAEVLDMAAAAGGAEEARVWGGGDPRNGPPGPAARG